MKGHRASRNHNRKELASAAPLGSSEQTRYYAMPERTSRVSDVAVARDETPQTQVTKPPPLGFGQVVATFNGLVNNLAGQLFAAPQRFTGPSPSANIVPLADRVVGQSPQRHFYSRYAKSLAVAFAAGAIPKARKWIAGLTASMIAAKALFGAKQ